MTLTKFPSIAACTAMTLGALVLVGCGGALSETTARPPSKATVQKSERAAAVGTAAAVEEILGDASWYGPKFQGRATASGERFDMNKLTAAHRTLPFGTRVRVTNPENGRSVIVRINDRGPFSGRRVIDLSRKAAEMIGLRAKGVGRVILEVLRSA